MPKELSGKFTPTLGPWKYDDMGYIWQDRDTHAMMIAEIRGWGHLTSCDMMEEDDARTQQDVNGRLLAAAPDLLEACRFAFSEIDKSGLPSLISAAARLSSAMAKAEGGES